MLDKHKNKITLVAFIDVIAFIISVVVIYMNSSDIIRQVLQQATTQEGDVIVKLFETGAVFYGTLILLGVATAAFFIPSMILAVLMTFKIKRFSNGWLTVLIVTLETHCAILLLVIALLRQ